MPPPGLHTRKLTIKSGPARRTMPGALHVPGKSKLSLSFFFLHYTYIYTCVAADVQMGRVAGTSPTFARVRACTYTFSRRRRRCIAQWIGMGLVLYVCMCTYIYIYTYEPLDAYFLSHAFFLSRPYLYSPRICIYMLYVWMYGDSLLYTLFYSDTDVLVVLC